MKKFNELDIKQQFAILIGLFIFITLIVRA